MDGTANSSNTESTILPLLSICSITSEYSTEPQIKKRKIEYNLLTDKDIPKGKSPQLLSLVHDCQEFFEKEANILLENQLSSSDVNELYKKYKQYLLNCYLLKPDYYENSEITNISAKQPLIFDEAISYENLSNTNSNSFSSTQDFDFDFASFSTTSNDIDIQPYFIEFDSSQLYNGPDSLYSDSSRFTEFENQSTPTNEIMPKAKNFKCSSLQSRESRHDDCFQTSRRRITKEKKALLDSIFSVKNFPNNAERKLIAEKCNLSPSQVRIWFTNKRARCKGRN